MIMAVTSCFCSVVRPAEVIDSGESSRDKRSYRVNTCTLVSADSSSIPERVEYDVHWASHASNPVVLGFPDVF